MSDQATVHEATIGEVYTMCHRPSSHHEWHVNLYDIEPPLTYAAPIWLGHYNFQKLLPDSLLHAGEYAAALWTAHENGIELEDISDFNLHALSRIVKSLAGT